MRIRTVIIIVVVILISSFVAYLFMPHARAWPRGAWDAADHNQDGNLTRQEMIKFGNQQPHRNVERLLWQFDSADTNGDQIVDTQEVESYGNNIGSKDPNGHLPPPKLNQVKGDK